MATLAEREHGAVAGPEALWATRTIAAITPSTRGFAKPEAGTPSLAICGPLTVMPPIWRFVWSGFHDQAVARVPGELAPHYAAGRRRGPPAAGHAGEISSGRSAGAFWS